MSIVLGDCKSPCCYTGRSARCGRSSDDLLVPWWSRGGFLVVSCLWVFWCRRGFLCSPAGLLVCWWPPGGLLVVVGSPAVSWCLVVRCSARNVVADPNQRLPVAWFICTLLEPTSRTRRHGSLHKSQTVLELSTLQARVFDAKCSSRNASLWLLEVWGMQVGLSETNVVRGGASGACCNASGVLPVTAPAQLRHSSR